MLQEITPYKGMVVQRITVSTTPCESWPPHCGWAMARGSSRCLLISTAAGQHLPNPGPVFANLLGVGTGHIVFGLILPASLIPRVVSMWESAWE